MLWTGLLSMLASSDRDRFRSIAARLMTVPLNRLYVHVLVDNGICCGELEQSSFVNRTETRCLVCSLNYS